MSGGVSVQVGGSLSGVGVSLWGGKVSVPGGLPDRDPPPPL